MKALENLLVRAVAMICLAGLSLQASAEAPFYTAAAFRALDDATDINDRGDVLAGNSVWNIYTGMQTSFASQPYSWITSKRINNLGQVVWDRTWPLVDGRQIPRYNINDLGETIGNYCNGNEGSLCVMAWDGSTVLRRLDLGQVRYTFLNSSGQPRDATVFNTAIINGIGTNGWVIGQYYNRFPYDRFPGAWGVSPSTEIRGHFVWTPNGVITNGLDCTPVDLSNNGYGVGHCLSPTFQRIAYLVGFGPEADVLRSLTKPYLLGVNDKGTVIGKVPNGSSWRSFIWDQVYGFRYLDQIINGLPSDVSLGDVVAINNAGQILIRGGHPSVVGPLAVVLQPSTAPPLPVSVELIDPNASMIVGGVVTADRTKLATGGRNVRGVAADGVATLLLRFRGGAPGQQVHITVPDVGCTSSLGSVTDVCGALGEPGSTPARRSHTVTLEASALGAVGYALYRAPLDFSWSPEHHSLKERKAPLTYKVDDDSADRSMAIDVVRPPLLLVHGLWSNARDSWYSGSKGFSPVAESEILQAIPFDYKETNAYSISNNAASLMRFVDKVIDVVGLYRQVAISQVDFVGHSMGGLLVRYMPNVPGYSQKSRFKRGLVHKLIAIGTPHRGSRFAAALTDTANSCVSRALNLMYWFDAIPPNRVAGAITDLVPGSVALGMLKRVPTALIAGSIGPGQYNDVRLKVIQDLTKTVCSVAISDIPLADHLKPDKYRLFMGGDHDGIVSVDSATDGANASRKPVHIFTQGTWTGGFLHAGVLRSLGFIGNSLLDGQAAPAFQVNRLINIPVSSLEYQ